MNAITLVEVTLDNLRDICRLSGTLTPEQQRCVAPNSFSIAEGMLTGPDAWFRAIYLDDVPIGFVMVNIGTDEWESSEIPSVFLWRFMIALPYQQKGYGKHVLDMLVKKFRDEGYKVLYTSCDMGPGGPYNFYMSYGFIDTGEMESDEEVLKFLL